MKFEIGPPPTSPTSAEEEDALRKGLGRAMHWAQMGVLSDDLLLKACLTDQRFDSEIADCRAEWLWELMNASHSESKFRAAILEELRTLPDPHNAFQLCSLGSIYAANGDEAFRSALYQIVEQSPANDATTFAEEMIVKLDGEEGLLFAARIHSRRLQQGEWDCDDENLVESAITHLGEDRVQACLSVDDVEELKRFYEGWLERDQTEPESQKKLKEKIQALTAEEIITEAGKEKPSIGFFRPWGNYANDRQLNTVLEAVWTTNRPSTLVNLLRVFSKRTMPAFDTRLLDLCGHEDEKVRHWAFNALHMISHPIGRAYAFAHLDQGIRDQYVAGLFIQNYEPGDENLILDAIELPDDENELHWLLMSVTKVLENNDVSDPSKLALIVYELTPCEACRKDAVKILKANNQLPDWIENECRWDSSKECRELVQTK